MLTLKTFVVFLSLVCFAVAALGIGTGRFNLIALGLLLWEALTFFS